MQAKKSELEEKTRSQKTETVRAAAVIEKIRDSVGAIYSRLHSTKLGPDLDGPPSSTAIDLDRDLVVDILNRLIERTASLQQQVCLKFIFFSKIKA